VVLVVVEMAHQQQQVQTEVQTLVGVAAAVDITVLQITLEVQGVQVF
jgi:hypothetical protein